MKRFVPAAVAEQDGSLPAPAAPTDQHEWLQQLVGEWEVSSKMSMGPDAEATTMQSTESVRSIGGLWTLGEGRADFGGRPFTSIMTLGYDPGGRRKILAAIIEGRVIRAMLAALGLPTEPPAVHPVRGPPDELLWE